MWSVSAGYKVVFGRCRWYFPGEQRIHVSWTCITCKCAILCIHQMKSLNLWQKSRQMTKHSLGNMLRWILRMLFRFLILVTVPDAHSIFTISHLNRIHLIISVGHLFFKVKIIHLFGDVFGVSSYTRLSVGSIDLPCVVVCSLGRSVPLGDTTSHGRPILPTSAGYNLIPQILSPNKY